MKRLTVLAALMLAAMPAAADPMMLPLPVGPEMVAAPHMSQTAQDAARLERMAGEERERQEREPASTPAPDDPSVATPASRAPHD